MAHPQLVRRSVLAVSMSTAMFAFPFAGSAFALGEGGAIEPVTAAVDAALPAPVAEAVDAAATPVVDAVGHQVAPALDEVVAKAPGPVRQIIESIAPSGVPSGPSTGPVPRNPLPAKAPQAGDSATSVTPPAAASSRGGMLERAQSAAAPLTYSPFPGYGLVSDQTPVSAGREIARAATTPDGSGASGWLVATATAMLIIVGAAHVAYADRRLSAKASPA